MLHYLSVHDFVWINSTVIGKTVPFDFEKLEACMAAQYGYGDSTDVTAQGANLLGTLLSSRPFESGNLRTAFIASVAFLTANRKELQVDDKTAAETFKKAMTGAIVPPDAISTLFKSGELGLRSGASIRSLVTYIYNEHVEALRLLADGD